MSEMSCSMVQSMGYNYPITQGSFYSIQATASVGYFCPMDMTFREALDHAIASGRAKSWRDVATRSGVSYDILKNIKQGKSQRPNAEDALKVAGVFRVSLEQFYRGELDAPEDDPAIEEDMSRLMDAIRAMKGDGSIGKVADFAQIVLDAEKGKSQKR